MSIISSELLLGAAGAAGGYEIERGLRFTSANSSYLERTPSSNSNRQTFTLSWWIKRCEIKSSNKRVFAYTSGTDQFSVMFDSNGAFYTYFNLTSPSDVSTFTTRDVFRDPSAWYHFVMAFDTTQATETDRVKMWVNGVQITQFQNTDYPSLNSSFYWNSTVPLKIGGYSPYYIDDYLADIHSIDGQALDPTSFGAFDDNGVWQPKAYSGSYGTNGFHLPFSDNSTAAALGTDTSGNGNDWTVNNISVSPGADNDSLFDSPTNGTQTDTGAGGELSGNYCVFNPAIPTTYTLVGGNLTAGFASGTDNLLTGTLGVSSGKWYWEFRINSGNVAMIGIADFGADQNSQRFNGAGGLYYYQDGGYLYGGLGKTSIVSTESYGSGYTTGDIIGVALNMDSNPTTLVFYKNNTSQGTATNATMAGKIVGPSYTNGGGATNISANFGQRPFVYTAPSGYKALCTANMPDPTIADGSTAMDAVLYSGNSSSQSISGYEFSPDLIWIKARNIAYGHCWFDTIRGTNSYIASDTTNTENPPTGFASFDSNGFSFNAGWTLTNESARTYVGWCWDGGSSTDTNTDGDITSSVRANPSAGFSIVKWTSPPWTGSSFNRQVGHGLNAAPHFIITKNLDSNASWYCYHKYMDAVNPNDYYMTLNTVNARGSLTDSWGPNIPDSTTFGDRQLGWGDNQEVIAYCFAPVEGYSMFGIYGGNGITEGPFIYTGFRPAFIIYKSTNISTAANEWFIRDYKRVGYNGYPDVNNNPELEANSSDSENNNGPVDILSNGFKIRNNNPGHNESSGTYIWAAFAEHPFKTSRAR